MMSPLAHSVMFAAFGALCLWTPITQKAVNSGPATPASDIQTLFGDMSAASIVRVWSRGYRRLFIPRMWTAETTTRPATKPGF